MKSSGTSEVARFGVYELLGRKRRGYVLDVQADILHGLKTRVVVPLVSEDDAPPKIRDLNPMFEVLGRPYVMLTQAIVAVPTKELGAAATYWNEHREPIVRALDILLVGH